LPSNEELKKQVIDNLIFRELERQVVKRANITVSDTELNGALDAIAKRNNIDVTKLREAVEKSGMNYKEYREQVREQMTFARIQQQQAGKIIVTDQEVDDFLAHYKNTKQPDSEYHVQDILIPLSDNPSPEEVKKAEQQAEALLAKIRGGTDFKEVAAANSKGQQALQGGDLGWRTLAEMPQVFADAVKEMHTGEVKGPLRAPNGFHLLQISEIRQTNQQLNKEMIRNLIYQRKIEEKTQKWLKGLRDSAYIKFV
jgi:peptidyl-prolyl cis-trans isomerase SurA